MLRKFSSGVRIVGSIERPFRTFRSIHGKDYNVSWHAFVLSYLPNESVPSLLQDQRLRMTKAQGANLNCETAAWVDNRHS